MPPSPVPIGGFEFPLREVVLPCPARLASVLVLSGLALLPTTTLDVESAGVESKPAHHLSRGFRNPNDRYRYDVGVRMRHFVLGALANHPPRGGATSILANDGAALRANGTHPTVTWVGHSTFLVQLDGVDILTDPHWGDRASPVASPGHDASSVPGSPSVTSRPSTPS